MLDICNSIDSAIETQNWYAAVMVALSLPDICGAIEYPQMRQKKVNGIDVNRYTKWFDNFVGKDYKVYKKLDPSSPDYQGRLQMLQQHSHHLRQVSEYDYEETFLNGFECYILRCQYLHQGYGNVISEDRARNILNGFDFRSVGPAVGTIVHNNLSVNNGNIVVQLRVDIFSKGISDAARAWWNARTDKEMYRDSFLKIRSL